MRQNKTVILSQDGKRIITKYDDFEITSICVYCDIPEIKKMPNGGLYCEKPNHEFKYDINRINYLTRETSVEIIASYSTFEQAKEVLGSLFDSINDRQPFIMPKDKESNIERDDI